MPKKVSFTSDKEGVLVERILNHPSLLEQKGRMDDDSHIVSMVLFRACFVNDLNMRSRTEETAGMSELLPAFPLTGVKASQEAALPYLQNTLLDFQ